MSTEKRLGLRPVPDNLGEVLTQPQIISLRQIEGYGWQLRFVRRPTFEEIVPVVSNDVGSKFGILEKDGSFIQDPDIKIRSYAQDRKAS